MQGYLVVLNTKHFAVTGGTGRFALTDLPAGKYTVTAWHELYGTQSREITVASGQTLSLNFNFQAKL